MWYKNINHNIEPLEKYLTADVKIGRIEYIQYKLLSVLVQLWVVPI